MWWYRFCSTLAPVAWHHQAITWINVDFSCKFLWHSHKRKCTESTQAVEWVWKVCFLNYCHLSKEPMSLDAQIKLSSILRPGGGQSNATMMDRELLITGNKDGQFDNFVLTGGIISSHYDSSATSSNKTIRHWKWKIINLATVLSLAAVVIIVTYIATSDDKIVKLMIFCSVEW